MHAQLLTAAGRRLVAAPGDEVAAADFGLHLIAAPLEQLLDRPVERRLPEGVIILSLHAEH